MSTLFIFNGFSAINGTEFSGGDYHAIMLANLIAQNSQEEVRVLISAHAQQTLFLQKFSKKVNFVFLPSLPNEQIIYRYPGLFFFLALFRICATPFYWGGDGTVVATSHIFFDVIPLLFLDKNKKRYCFIHHIMSLQDRKGTYGWLTNFLEKISFFVLKRKKVKIIVTSPLLKKKLIEIYGFNKESIFESTNGIDIKSYQVEEKRVKKQYELLFAGRLQDNKGIFDFVNLVDNLVKKYHQSIKACIIGNGIAKEKMLKRIHQLDLTDKIDYLGFVSEKEKKLIMKKSQILAMCSHEEGWSITTGEALSSGTPVVAYALPDIIDVWQKTAGGVDWVRRFDIEDFSKKVMKLLTDKKYYQQQSLQGRKNVMRYDWDRVLPREAKYISST